MLTSSRVAQKAISRPAADPAAASRNDSVSNCRTMRRRAPPTARRIAISLARAVPRASSMLAIFRHAMTSTTPDTAIRSAEATASPVSVCGEVLVDIRGSSLTSSVWSLFSAG